MVSATEGGVAMPFCIHCGKEVSEDALVCPRCGKTLAIAPTAAEKQTPKQASGLEVAGLSLGVIGSAAVILAGIDMASTDITGVGFAFIGLGLFLMGILSLVFARVSRS
jgi:predicted RNA-binding Zn-ribbon protein involved in translation (DUF1610 family)